MTMHKALHSRDDVDRLYMFQEKKEEEDFPALKTPMPHLYNDSKTIYKNTKEASLQPPDNTGQQNGNN